MGGDYTRDERGHGKLGNVTKGSIGRSTTSSSIDQTTSRKEALFGSSSIHLEAIEEHLVVEGCKEIWPVFKVLHQN